MAIRYRLNAIAMIAGMCCFLLNCSSSPKKPTALQFVSPTSAPTIELATPQQTVSLTANQAVTWSLQSGVSCQLPQGTLSSTQGNATIYTAPATNIAVCPSGPLLITVVATSVADPSESAAMVVKIVQTSPAIDIHAGQSLTPATCPSAGTLINPATIAGTPVVQVGSFYSVTIADTGYFQPAGAVPAPTGVPPFTWKMTGSLPAGLAMSAGTDTSNIVVSGTPLTSACDATTTFTLQLTDATGVAAAPVTYSLAVIPPSLKLQAPTLPAAFNQPPAPQGGAGVPYAPVSYNVSGGTPPYAWAAFNTSANNPLPGVSLSPISTASNIAVVAGSPAAGSALTSAAPYTNQIQISDSQQPYPAVVVTGSINTYDLVLSQFCTQQVTLGGLNFSSAYVNPNSINGGVIADGSVLTDSYLQGNVAFLVRGLDANNGPMVIAGSVTLDGAGNVTGGEEDVTTSSGHQSLVVQPGSSYTVGVETYGAGSPASNFSRGCMALSLKNPATQATASSTFAFTLGGCSNRFTESKVTSTADNACGMAQNGNQNVAAGQFTRGRIIEFDCPVGNTCTGAGSRASGILRVQDASSFSGGVTGGYAFGMSGQDAVSGHYAVAGSFQASSGNLASVAADIDDAGTLGSNLTGGSGTLSSADANGRVAGSLSVGQATFGIAGYVVGANEVMLVTTDTLAQAHPILGGEAITSTGPFNATALQNSHIFHIGGVTSGSADVSIGVLSFDGIGTLTGTEYEDQGGTLGTSALSGAYIVDSSSGRTVFQAAQGQNLGAHPFVAYVIPVPASLNRSGCSSNQASCVTGFLVGTDSSAQDGVLEFQTATTTPPPPFQNVFILGDYQYGTDEILDAKVPSVEGNAYASVSTNSTTAGTLGTSTTQGSHPLFQDRAFGDPEYCLQSGCEMLIPSESLQGAYSVSPNGTGSFGNGKVAVTNGSVIFYIDQSTMTLSQGSVLLDPHPSVVVAEQ